MPQLFLKKSSNSIYNQAAVEIRELILFPKSNSPKLNARARLEIELTTMLHCPVDRRWGQNTPIASLQRGKTAPNRCPGYGAKQSDREVSVMQELQGMQSTHSLLLLPGPLRPGVVAFDRVLFMGQIELFEI